MIGRGYLFHVFGRGYFLAFPRRYLMGVLFREVICLLFCVRLGIGGYLVFRVYMAGSLAFLSHVFLSTSTLKIDINVVSAMIKSYYFLCAPFTFYQAQQPLSLDKSDKSPYLQRVNPTSSNSITRFRMPSPLHYHHILVLYQESAIFRPFKLSALPTLPALRKEVK